MRCKIWEGLIGVFLGVIGILFILYPIIYRSQGNNEMLERVNQYWQDVGENESLETLYAAGIAYNAGLVSGEEKGGYTKLLAIDSTGIMGVLSIPKLDLKLPIYHGTEDRILGKGVGHLEGTSLPLEGNAVHAVLCGHSGMPNIEVFDHIDELAKGDLIYIYVLEHTMVYEIINCLICLPEEAANMIYVQDNKNILTLITCTPYGINTHRLLVIAELKK